MTSIKTEPQSKTTHYDIVIIGAGMIGASFVCAVMPAIRKFNLKVAMIERFSLLEQTGDVLHQPSYDERSTAISYGSRCLLQQFGLWDLLKSQTTPIEHIHISDQGSFGKTRLHAHEYNIEALGYVIGNAWLGRVLLQKIKTSSLIDCISPASVLAITPVVDDNGQSYQRLSIKNNEEIRQIETRLAVVADGGRSQICQQIGIKSQQSNYQQSAIIANISVTKPHQNVAYERFTKQGPIALLPLNETQSPCQNRLALILTSPSDRTDALLALDDTGFLAQLQQCFGYQLGCVTHVGKRESYPLTRQCLSEQVRPGIVVIGNAAHTLHPVAGQGFNLALRGVMALVQQLTLALINGHNIGSLHVLQTYVKKQQADQQQTILFTDQLLKLFCSNNPLIGHLRGFGLLALDLFRPANNIFAHRAMGLGDQLPRVNAGINK